MGGTAAIVRYGPRAPMSNPMPHIVASRKEAAFVASIKDATHCTSSTRGHDIFDGVYEDQLCLFEKLHQSQYANYLNNASFSKIFQNKLVTPSSHYDRNFLSSQLKKC